MKGHVPVFRQDLNIIPRLREGGGFYYIVQDGLGGTMLELGEEEYFLCRGLNGSATFESLQESFRQRFGYRLPEEQLRALVHQLDYAGFLTTSQQANRGREDELIVPDRVWPLFDPNRLFSWLAALFSWWFNPVFLVLSLAVILAAAGVLVRHGSDFLLETKVFWKTGGNFLLPILGIVTTNVIGEVVKGIACRYYGGQVASFNLTLIYRLVPRFFSDTSNAIFERERRAHLLIHLAGSLAQVLFCALCIIAWNNTTGWSVMHTVWLVLAQVSMVYVLLNLNPFLERDGYYILSLWTDMRYLRNRALRVFKYRITGRGLPEPLSAAEMKLFWWFGLLILIFETGFWSLILGTAGFLLTSKMKGVGAIFFLVVLCLRFEQQIRAGFTRMEKWGERRIMLNQTGSIRIRYLVQFGILLIIVVVMLLPYRSSVSGEFSLRPVAQFGIRAQVPGRIEEVFVEQGEKVKAGEPVARLDSRDQQRRFEEAQATRDNIKAQLDLLLAGPKPEEIAKAEQEVEAARTSLRHSEKLLRRQEEMYRNKAVSEKDYDEALKARDMDRERLKIAIKNLDLVKSGPRKEEIRAMEAQLRLAEVDVDFARKELELTTLRSPIDGHIITAFPVQSEGQYLDKGDMFAVVEDSSRLLVDIQLPEEDISQVRQGAEVVLKTWAEPARKFTTKVRTVAPVAFEKQKGRVIRALSEKEWLFERKVALKDEGRVVTVLADLTNGDSWLKTDMTGYAKIQAETRPVYAVFFRWLSRFIRVEIWSWIP